MDQFAGKTAFVTGGASGIGFAMGRAFAELGMQVMLADIEQDALSSALNELRQFGGSVRGVACDVADSASVGRAADETFKSFGNVHILCNNAGVAAGGGIESISLESWRWVLDVNVMGVVHGLRAFLPHMRAHGEGGHIVNTASMAGLQSQMGLSPYSASKYAVVSISEGLSKELAGQNIGVSVLCPSFVRTRIGTSSRNRQGRYGSASVAEPGTTAAARAEEIQALLQDGLDPSEIAAHVVAGIRANELYVLTHVDWSWEVEERLAAIQDAMKRVATRLS